MTSMSGCGRGSLRRIVAAAILALGVGTGAQAESLGFRQAVSEAAAGDRVVADFYLARDFAPLWTGKDDGARRAALMTALREAGMHGLPVGRYAPETIVAEFSALDTERARGFLEAQMTEVFLRYAHDVQTGIIDPARADDGIVREVPLRDPAATLLAFAAADPARFIRDLPPHSPAYTALMKEKVALEAAIAAGGWGPIVPVAKLEAGDRGKGVVALRDRLYRLGYLGRSATQDYDGAIMKAVQRFQIDNGLTADGVAGQGTIEVLNTAPEDRLKSVLVAMERLRWMNGISLGKRHVWVNLTDFTAKIVDDGHVTFETVTVVGMNQHDRRSPEFSDQIEFMVINPTWNVPRSIAVKEYLPMLQKDPNAVRHLRIVDRSGRAVNRAETDFTQFTAQSFPFSISQAPSGDNALGLVKFMFPNRWNIYLHDTPSKSLFNREIRAFSHGCIRLGKPFDFAYALLAPQSDNPRAEFASHLNTGRENTLMLDRPVPVHLVYFTAWPDEKGRVGYRRDVYGRDGRVFDEMKKAGVVLPGVQG
ncbi:MAG: L,D-transpeptidase family protein [Rhodobacteraceae bacterium]|nr:L,D-transpeptidase family protein [Paracoccaceae bacterium]